MKNLKLFVVLFLFMFIATSVLAQGVKVVGSTTIKPIMEKVTETFTNITIFVEGGGSSAGVKAAGSGTADIGMASRKINEKETAAYSDIVIHTIANDGVGVIIHADNALSAITKSQLKKIYTGSITNWSQLGGQSAPITIITKDIGHSTLGLFLEYVGMTDEETVSNALRAPANQDVFDKVSTTKNAIGYVSIGGAQFQIEKKDVPIKLLTLDGVEATIDNVADSLYPLNRPLNLVTKGEPTGDAKNIIKFFSTEFGKNLIYKEGFIPAN